MGCGEWHIAKSCLFCWLYVNHGLWGMEYSQVLALLLVICEQWAVGTGMQPSPGSFASYMWTMGCGEWHIAKSWLFCWLYVNNGLWGQAFSRVLALLLVICEQWAVGNGIQPSPGSFAGYMWTMGCGEWHIAKSWLFCWLYVDHGQWGQAYSRVLALLLVICGPWAVGTGI